MNEGRIAARRGPSRKDQEMGSREGVSNGSGRGALGGWMIAADDSPGCDDDDGRAAVAAVVVRRAARNERWKARPEGPSPRPWEYSKAMK